MIKNAHNMINLVMQIQIKALVVEEILVVSAVLKIFSVRSLAVAVEDVVIQMHHEKEQILQYTMTLAFEEAVFGKETEIEIPREETCDTCNGSGAKPGTKPETCSHCNGTGQLNVEQNTPFGRMVNRRACHHCHGTGKIIKHKCTTCHGAGKVKKRKKIQVKIPAGVDDGQQLRVSGQGEPGINGGPCRRFIYCISCSSIMNSLNVMAMIFIVKCQLHLLKQHLVMKLKYQLFMEK